MSPLLGILIASACATGAIWLVVGALRLPRPPLARIAAGFYETPAPPTSTIDGMTTVIARLLPKRFRFGRTITTELRLINRSTETHLLYLVAGGAAGFTVPTVLALLARAAGMTRFPLVIPVGVGLLAGLCTAAGVQWDAGARADQTRSDLRYQLSAFVDLLTMLLSGNHGNEGAIRTAASAGDGRLFVVLRRHIVEAAAAGRSLTTALHSTGVELDVVELREIALSASLATSRGAPIARSLTAKCAGLRAALSAELEQAARVRSGKLTFPLVGMGLVFMAIVIYPALAGNPLGR